MPRRSRHHAAVLTLGALATTALLPATAQAASTQHHPTRINGGAKPALARAHTYRPAATTGNGITAVLTPTAVAGDGLTFTFDSTASTDSNPGATINGYTFDFGDGTTPVTNTTGTTTHTYAHPGTYTASVTVTDTADNTATTTSPDTTQGSDYTAQTPQRILDTRSGIGAPQAKLTPTRTISLQVTGASGIPTNATGAVINLTAVDTAGNGVVTCYPDGSNTPSISNLNFGTGQTIVNLITVKLPPDGIIDCADTGAANSSTDLVGDLQGYYSPIQSLGYTAIQPGRFLDSRNGTGGVNGTLANGKTFVVPIDGATATVSTAKTGTTTESLPATGISAVAINLTATNTTGAGVITAYPDGSPAPTASNLNYTNGTTIANAAIVKVGTDGKIDLTSTGTETTTADLIGDITGYYTTGSPAVYIPVTPTRLLDTRNINGQDLPLIAGNSFNLHNLTTANGVTGYLLNTTVASPTTVGDLATLPAGGGLGVDPLYAATSTLNFATNQIIANFTQATTGPQGTEYQDFQTSGDVELIVDEFGYLTTQ